MSTGRVPIKRGTARRLSLECPVEPVAEDDEPVELGVTGHAVLAGLERLTRMINREMNRRV